MAKDKDPKNVVALPPRPPAPDSAKVVPSLVTVLEGLLRSARAGELRAIGFAAIRSGGDSVVRGWARDDSGTDHHALAAAIGDLHFAYFRERYDNFDLSHHYQEAQNGQEDE